MEFTFFEMIVKNGAPDPFRLHIGFVYGFFVGSLLGSRWDNTPGWGDVGSGGVGNAAEFLWLLVCSRPLVPPKGRADAGVGIGMGKDSFS